METKETQIRPYKWSAWDFEIYSRDRNGKTEYAEVEKQMSNDDYNEFEGLEKMGFKTHEDRMQMSDDYIRRVVKFNKCQRKLGE